MSKLFQGRNLKRILQKSFLYPHEASIHHEDQTKLVYQILCKDLKSAFTIC